MGILTGVSFANMPTPEMPDNPTPRVPPSSGGAAVARWTGTRSVFDPEPPGDLTRTLKAQGTSFLVHGVVAALLVWGFVKGQQIVEDVKQDRMKFDIVYLQSPGPGGGGGGSPQPAPPKKVELPTPKAVPPPPVVSVPTPTIPPPPSINAPVMTAPTALLSASGVTGTVDVPVGGGGSGGGIGSGKGNGLGDGTGGGFGGGAYKPGAGIENPQRIREVKPQYTPEAMRAKIQGTVELEAVVGPDGKVTDVRVIRSLDRVFGLDEQAKKAVLATPFIPGKKDGKPVAVLVVFELAFTLR